MRLQKKESTEKSIYTFNHVMDRVKDEPKQEIIWNGIPEGSCGLITGVAKTGKTTLAENLALNICSGKGDFLGLPLKWTGKKVCFLSFEENYRIRASRWKNQAKVFSKTDVEKIGVNFTTNMTNIPEFLNDDSDWQKVKDYINEINPDLIILDSLSRMCIGEIEKSSTAQSFVQKFNKYIKSLGKTTFVIHHNVKGNNKPISIESIAGSRFITQEFEFAIGMAKIPSKQGGNYMKVIYNKYANTDNQKSITYSLDNNIIQKTGTCYAEDFYKENYKQEDGRIDDSNKSIILNTIQNFLKNKSTDSQDNQDSQEDKFKSKDILDLVSVEMSKDTFYRQLKKLTEEGQVSKLRGGKYKLNFKN